eukprot:COSAG01_NODE_1793_length_9215_cov_16.655002_8_plen_92_part_00
MRARRGHRNIAGAEGRRRHLIGPRDGGNSSTGGALALGAALGLLLALEGAVSSRGRCWHRSGLEDGGDGGTGGAHTGAQDRRGGGGLGVRE